MPLPTFPTGPIYAHIVQGATVQANSLFIVIRTINPKIMTIVDDLKFR